MKPLSVKELEDRELPFNKRVLVVTRQRKFFTVERIKNAYLLSFRESLDVYAYFNKGNLLEVL